MSADPLQPLGTARTFEDLWIWQQARCLVKDVYLDFDGRSNARRDFKFRDQVQAAAISVMNNIAEGFERTTDGEFARFLDIAKGSCGELRSMYYAAQDLDYVTPQTADLRRHTAKRISAGIAGLTAHLRSSRVGPPRNQ